MRKKSCFVKKTTAIPDFAVYKRMKDKNEDRTVRLPRTLFRTTN